ncbi:metal-dependent transcriptional regulator [Actinomarinicola tropica]|uniref:Manganese transport regulator n=1 Tax=Actinomarinicola tropica TaxID=2789776 RepID=A0A5Q2RHU1_9ACTN|nr:metal-dependent transcriptional regulator [Actinomarinicola tropica]QGG95373.1 metal-dependent transcriptional regulator [Actinomarinicola tropica]
MPDQLSRSDREMLKAIYRQTVGHTADPDRFAHTGDLAEAMGTSPGTATSHVKRLADRGLVSHTPYIGVRLTDTGRAAAVGAIRRHRLVERFLADYLGYEWTDADRLATTFEHDLPDEVEQRLFLALGEPTSCPHGFPIPAATDVEVVPLPPLYDLEPGDVAVVAVPGSTDPALVEYLDTIGLRPGAHVEVREKEPFDGPVLVRVDGQDRALGRTVATQVFVRALDGSPPPGDHPAA